MTIQGNNLLGLTQKSGKENQFYAIEAATGQRLEPSFGGADMADVEYACDLAWRAFRPYRDTAPDKRARFLEVIAHNILAIGDELVERCMVESGLPRGRIEDERDRTVGQLRFFAEVVRDGSYLGVRIVPALPERQPTPRPDLRLRNVAIGPVAVFGASNFPLAFSVAGGDTASALAAGCPVVVKAHPAHPGISELVGRVVQDAVRECGMPEGTFSLIFTNELAIGQALVANRHIKSVGFTGSRSGGTALMAVAATRPEPIPVYAEMSSINPVVLFPGALSERASEIGTAFAASLTLGAGQFCTNPGLILAVESADLDRFIDSAWEKLAAAAAQAMLTPGIYQAYCAGVDSLARHPTVTKIGHKAEADELQAHPALFSVSGADFLASPELGHEVFGASSLIVRCRDESQLAEIVEALEGQLTIALHLAGSDLPAAATILPMIEEKAGRLLVNGFGTGVEVAHAMVHGGPYPATSDGRSTSVGSLAIARFLRPVCYQDMPRALLPEVLKQA